MKGGTYFDVGHNHNYAGHTEPAPSGVPHKHQYHIKTSYDNGHLHTIEGVNRTRHPLPNGGHIHRFNGTTTLDGDPQHKHYYKGETGV